MKLPTITAKDLGNQEFKKDFNLTYAYLSGAMVHGIASAELVVRMGKSGMMGFFGSGGMALDKIRDNIDKIQSRLTHGESWGVNILNSSNEMEVANLLMDCHVTIAEASGYMQISSALVKYRLKGLTQAPSGEVVPHNRIIGKISHPLVASLFMSSAPENLVKELLASGEITEKEAELSKTIPVADALCVEADSGGHTDMGNAFSLVPTIISLRDEIMEKHKYAKRIMVGAAGGIGTPEAAGAAFFLGADFILTGSINQCTVESGVSDVVKNLLQTVGVHDMAYAPAGDMFELGAKVQVVRKGGFFSARANKLYDLYRNFNSLDEIDQKTKKQLEERYFQRSFEDIYEDAKAYYPKEVIEKADQNPKQKMACIFKWYFGLTNRLALEGNEDRKVDFQIHCGPALGSFNQWVKNSKLDHWQNRHVDEIGIKIMEATAGIFNERLNSVLSN